MVKIGKPRSSKGLAVLCAKIADEKIAHDILIMNLTNIESSPTDYFVICTCDADVHINAVVDAIKVICSDLGIDKPRAEGLKTSSWVLLDFFDVVVHIMLKNTREYYNLERIWGDSQFLRLNEEGLPRVIKKYQRSIEIESSEDL